MPALIVALTLAALLGCKMQTVEAAPGELTIYYIPFDVETFSPVTVDLIESQASCVFHLSALDPSAQRLRELLSRSADGEFDGRRVRLKAAGLAKAPVFVDADGGLRNESGNESRLEQGNFEALRQIMSELATREDCDLYGERAAR